MSKFYVRGVFCWTDWQHGRSVCSVETIVDAVDKDVALWVAARDDVGVDLDDPKMAAYFDDEYNDTVIEEVPEGTYIVNIKDRLLDITRLAEADSVEEAHRQLKEFATLLTGHETVLVKGA